MLDLDQAESDPMESGGLGSNLAINYHAILPILPSDINNHRLIPPGFVGNLLEYQNSTVNWMLACENVAFNQEDNLVATPLRKVPFTTRQGFFSEKVEGTEKIYPDDSGRMKKRLQIETICRKPGGSLLLLKHSVGR